MIKGSLVDILFQSTENNHLSQSESKNAINNQKSIKKKNYDLSLAQALHNKHSNKVIKITQFNSSLIIGEDKLSHKNYSASTSSPQKNFNIKKIVEFKKKVLASAQKAVEIQLKRKDCSFNINLKPNTAKKGPSGKQSIDKILITAQCNIKNQAPTVDNLAASLNLGDEVFIRDYDQQKKQYLSDILLGQKFELIHSKDLLAQTNQSIKGNAYTSSRKYGVCAYEQLGENHSATLSRKLPSPRKMYSRHIIQQKKYQQNLEKEKRQILQLKKELNKNYAKPFNPPQNITAQAYIIYQTQAKKIQYNRKLSIRKQQNEETLQTRKMLLNSHKVMASSNPRQAVEIASLTKIMTCLITLQISQRFQINLSEQEVTIGLFQQNIGGTTANIKKGEIYTVQQLLYGLMLPSGNDASLALAVWGGRTLLQRQSLTRDKPRNNGTSAMVSKKQSYDRFVSEMNIKASQLNMQKTKFANSHGLSNVDNKSCAFDLGILCQHAMSNRRFKQIVSTRIYECQVKKEIGEQNSPKLQEKEGSQQMRQIVKCQQQYNDQEDNLEGEQQMNEIQEMRQKLTENALVESEGDNINGNKIARWQNSHLLLQTKPDIYCGIKTGVTTTAGPCLASCIEIKGKRFIIIVLNCKSMKHRFKDTQNLRKWLFNKEQYKFKEKEKVNNVQQAN